jgi:hypothetical protein
LKYPFPPLIRYVFEGSVAALFQCALRESSRDDHARRLEGLIGAQAHRNYGMADKRPDRRLAALAFGGAIADERF